MKLGIAFDRLRWEEKALLDEAQDLGIDASLIDAKNLVFDLSDSDGDVVADAVLQRCISHYRALFLTRMLEGAGASVVNTYAVAELCGNKLATTMALEKAKVPTPRTAVALSSEMAEKAAEGIGFPVVLKPFVGSWGRMVHVVRDRQTLQALVELREELPNPVDHMYYVQEYIKRPPRDIRAVVVGEEIAASVYRYSPEGEWRTNVARGGVSKAFDADEPLKEMILKAASAVGGGVLGVDAMEGPGGYVIHEVNNTVEFKGAQSAVEWSIPRKIVQYVASGAKR